MKFNTFTDAKNYFSDNMNQLGEINEINVKEENFKNLKYKGYGEGYIKFTEKGMEGYDVYKWLTIIHDYNKVIAVEFGITGVNGWYDEV